MKNQIIAKSILAVSGTLLAVYGGYKTYQYYKKCITHQRFNPSEKRKTQRRLHPSEEKEINRILASRKHNVCQIDTLTEPASSRNNLPNNTKCDITPGVIHDNFYTQYEEKITVYMILGYFRKNYYLYETDTKWSDQQSAEYIEQLIKKRNMLQIIPEYIDQLIKGKNNEPKNEILFEFKNDKKICIHGAEQLTAIYKFFSNKISVSIDGNKYYYGPRPIDVKYHNKEIEDQSFNLLGDNIYKFTSAEILIGTKYDNNKYDKKIIEYYDKYDPHRNPWKDS